MTRLPTLLALTASSRLRKLPVDSALLRRPA